MSRSKKIEILLQANKKAHKTFEQRASNARLIVSADNFGLDAIAIALGIIW